MICGALWRRPSYLHTIILPYVVCMLGANFVCGYEAILLSYLLLHLHAVGFIQDETSVSGNV